MPRLALPVVACVVLLSACPPAATVKPTVDTGGAPPAAEVVAEVPHPEVSDQESEAAAAAERLRQLPPLYFALDSAQLQPESQEVLAGAAELLRRVPNVRLRVDGHTCELGTAEYNLALGHRRAEVVREYLVRLGVSPESVEVLSFGEEQPAEAGPSEDAFAKNRRSEVRVADASRAVGR